MHSDLKKLIRFSALQTRLLTFITAGFFIVTAFFVALFVRTEIHSHLSMAENGIYERMSGLDNKNLDFSRNVLLLKGMAANYYEEEWSSREWTREDQNRFVRMDPLFSYETSNAGAFAAEWAMAARLHEIQSAVVKSGQFISGAHYYSKKFRFISSYPSKKESFGSAWRKVSMFFDHGQADHDETFWMGPFFNENEGKNVLTNVVRVYRDGEVAGLVAIDISLDALSGYVTPLFDGRGQVLLVSRRGSVLASSGAKDVLERDVPSLAFKEKPPGEMKDLWQKILAKDENGFVYRNNYLLFWQPGRMTPVTMVYLIGTGDFIAYILPKLKVYSLSILTAVVFFLAGIHVLAKRFVKPTRIAEIALQRAHDELEVRVCERTTELQRMNEELKESREKYRQIFTHAPAGIYEIDFVKGKFVSVNDVLCEYTGYTKEEFLSLDPFSLLTEKGKQILGERMEAVLRGEAISKEVELDIIAKNGVQFSAVLNNNFIFDEDNITGSRVVIHDITERKIAEKALKKSEERFRNLVESTSDWIWDIDSTGTIVYSSPSVEPMTGYMPQEIQGQKFINFFPIYERERLNQILMENIRPGELLPFIECRILHKNGLIRTLETRGVHYFDDMGNMQGVRGISRDITNKKKDEAEKMELQKTLDRAKKMEALGLLAGGVAHDLNNILSGIINYPELILLDLPLDSPIRDQVKAIYLSGKKAAAIVDDLITVARGAARKKEIVDINTIIDEYLQSAEYSSMKVQYPEVWIHVSMDKELSTVTTSSVQVRKALLNLVINAVEAVQGRGIVTISSENIELTSPVRGYDEIPAGRYVLLSVSDTGGGISPEDMERIFEPFYSKKVMGRSGTGLGLAIVWNTVTEHGGHINVITGKNGTVFDLYFPANQFMGIPREKPGKLENVKGNGEKILVVDDEMIQREIATQLLENLDYSSVALESGEKAVEFLKKEHVDLVLLDMIMEPGMNGRETYERIIEINPEQKVIITTGYADTRDVRIAQEKGAGELLKKPYTLEELGKVVNRQLSR